MGNGSFQTNVDCPLWVACETRRPLATTLGPSGTVTRKVQVALSLGWSLSGIQVNVTLGSSPMNAPSGVCRKPYGDPNTIGEPTTVSGTPPYVTATLNVEFSWIRLWGVIWSSWPSRVKSAGTSLTVTA